MPTTATSRPPVEPLERRTMLSVQLAADIDTDTNSSDPRDFLALGDGAIFFALQVDGKYALWRTDGAAAGTTLVKPDLGAAPPDGFHPVAAGGKAYFQTSPAANVYQLWVTDGTSQGTRPLKDLRPGFPLLLGTPAQFVPFAGRVFFNATDAAGGTELWSTDGTPGGTAIFADVVPGSASSYVRALTVSGAYLYFEATAGGADTLWRTDGTPANTVRLGQFPLGIPTEAANLNGKLCFVAAGPGQYADQLWESDGTPDGTRVVKDLSAADTSRPAQLTVMGGALYFTAPTDANNIATLWRSDGTPGGTAPVVSDPPTGFFPAALAASAGQLFFSASDPAAGRELWRSDGTGGGTYRVRDVRPGTADGVPSRNVLPAPALGGAYFFANDGTNGNEPWFSDGSLDPARTYQVKDLYPGSFASLISDTAVLADGRLVFGGRHPETGAEPFVSDATAAGTHVLLDIETRNVGSAPTGLIDVNGKLVASALPPFALQDPARNELQRALFAVDPTTAAATFLTPAAPATSETSPFLGRGQLKCANFKGRTYYFSSTQAEFAVPPRFYRTDGTPAGSETFGRYYATNGDLAVLGDWLYFTASDNPALPTGISLYRTDGTVEGTQRVTPNTTATSTAAHPSATGDTLYFSINGDVYKITNADAAATDVGYTGGGIIDLRAVGPKAFFRRTISAGPGTYLGATDSSGAGLTATLGRTTYFVPFKGKVYFRESTTGNLYQSDGTTAGTRALSPGGKPIVGSNFRVAGDYLYFVASDAAHGSEWWRTDGTDAGTAIWLDMQPGAAGSDPSNISSIDKDAARTIAQWGDSIYFSAQVTGVGAELWQVDAAGGTPALVADLNPGTSGSDPTSLTVIGGSLYFIATRPDVGREVFRVVDDVPPTVADAAFDPAGAGRLRVRLSETVSVRSGATPPALVNRMTKQSVLAGSFAVSYDAPTRTLVVSPTAALADGYYRLTVPAGYLADAAGNPTAADHTFDFFVLAGDINRDRSVGFADLVVVAQNYGGTGKTYAQGDLDGDGTVGFADLVIVAQKYDAALPQLAAASPPAPAQQSAAPKRTTQRGRPDPKAIFSVTPVARPVAAKPKASARPRRR